MDHRSKTWRNLKSTIKSTTFEGQGQKFRSRSYSLWPYKRYFMNLIWSQYGNYNGSSGRNVFDVTYDATVTSYDVIGTKVLHIRNLLFNTFDLIYYSIWFWELWFLTLMTSLWRHITSYGEKTYISGICESRAFRWYIFCVTFDLHFEGHDLEVKVKVNVTKCRLSVKVYYGFSLRSISQLEPKLWQILYFDLENDFDLDLSPFLLKIVSHVSFPISNKYWRPGENRARNVTCRVCNIVESLSNFNM
jgi:hypothetical protein